MEIRLSKTKYWHLLSHVYNFVHLSIIGIKKKIIQTKLIQINLVIQLSLEQNWLFICSIHFVEIRVRCYFTYFYSNLFPLHTAMRVRKDISMQFSFTKS